MLFGFVVAIIDLSVSGRIRQTDSHLGRAEDH
jgi:hypothetical protein